MFLKASGYRVLTAADGDEALRLAEENAGAVDLLLTDVVMPKMNGRVLARQLAGRYPRMKVLYMSGYTNSFIAVRGVLEEGIHLLYKPFTEEALTRKVRELLESGADPEQTDRSAEGEGTALAGRGLSPR